MEGLCVCVSRSHKRLNYSEFFCQAYSHVCGIRWLVWTCHLPADCHWVSAGSREKTASTAAPGVCSSGDLSWILPGQETGLKMSLQTGRKQ